MRVQRFFTSKHNIDPASGIVSINEPALIKQIRNVLRLRAGDAVLILDGEGNLYRCNLANMSKSGITAHIQSTEQAGGEPEVKLTVAIPLLRSGRFEWALEKLTELGASSVIPTIYHRSVARGDNSKLDRWTAIVRESAEQCERGQIPRVTEVMDFSRVLQRSESKIVCVERSDSKHLTDLLHSNNTYNSHHTDILLAVGPEGGFTEEELRMVADTTASAISLGPRIMRAETAAIYASALIISHCRVDK
jgi:16S rRNA (uracil1498-N3)-methyltransferase